MRFGDAVNQYHAQQQAAADARTAAAAGQSTLTFGGAPAASLPGQSGLGSMAPSYVPMPQGIPQYVLPQMPYTTPQAASNIFGRALQASYTPANNNYSLNGSQQAKGGGGYTAPPAPIATK